MNYSTQTLPNSEVRITITVPASSIQEHYAKALSSIISNYEMDGFRKGAVPEKMVLARVGSMKVWEESLKEAIPSIYIQAITESKLPAIGRPHFAITKIADKSDAEVVVTTAVIPAITLPELKPVAQEVYQSASPDPVSESDLDEAVLELRRLRHKNEQSKSTENTSSESAEPTEPIAETELPELTPEYLAGFGHGITDIESLRARMRHNLEHERIHQFEDKKRAELIGKLIEATPFEVPHLLVDHEIELMLRQYEHDLGMSGISLDDYLNYTNKTRDNLRDDVREAATKRARTQLIVEKISEQESIKPDSEKVAKELEELENRFKNKSEFDREHAKSYVEQVYTNQAVFSYLEKLGDYSAHDHEAWHNHSH